VKPPQRLRLSRRRGTRLVSPDGRPVAVVARPTAWGNPYRVHEDATRTERAAVVARFEQELLVGSLPFGVVNVRRELAGKHLACWCKLDEPCHADVLLKVANG
jgi:hypothetical protein